MDANALNTALFAVRFALGVVFLAHGVKHFINREKTIRWSESLGFRSPQIQWMFMSFAELAIGVGMIAGFLTTLAAAALVAMMTVAFWTVHRHAGFWITARPDEGWEYAFVLVVTAVALAILGPGEWSLDHSIGISLDGWTGAWIALAGIPAAFGQLAAFFRPAARS